MYDSKVRRLYLNHTQETLTTSEGFFIYMEIWKQIPISDLEGYEISNLGRLRNRKGKVLRLCIKKNGYVFARLTLSERKKNYHIHHLVLIAFSGEKGLEVNHINHNRSDNRLENLEWSTRKENCNKKKTIKNFKKQIDDLYNSKIWSNPEEFYKAISNI